MALTARNWVSNVGQATGDRVWESTQRNRFFACVALWGDSASLRASQDSVFSPHVQARKTSLGFVVCVWVPLSFRALLLDRYLS